MTKRTGTGGLAAATVLLLVSAAISLMASASAGGVDGLTVLGMLLAVAGLVTGAMVASRWGKTLDKIDAAAERFLSE